MTVTRTDTSARPMPRRATRRIGAPVAAVVVSALLAGCSAASGSPDLAPAPQSETQAAPQSDLARLATAPGTDDGPFVGFDALARGTLRVNDANCYALGNDILVAPHGSEALGDGLGLSVPGSSDLRVGDPITFGGGYFEDAETLAAYADCADADTTGVVFMSDPR